MPVIERWKKYLTPVRRGEDSPSRNVHWIFIRDMTLSSLPCKKIQMPYELLLLSVGWESHPTPTGVYTLFIPQVLFFINSFCHHLKNPSLTACLILCIPIDSFPFVCEYDLQKAATQMQLQKLLLSSSICS